MDVSEIMTVSPSCVVPIPPLSRIAPCIVVEPAPASQFLIAMDGTRLSLPALRVGSALARHCELAPRLLTIIEPLVAAPSAPGHSGCAWPDDGDHMQRVSAIREQVREAAPEGSEWPIDAEIGNPTEAIAWTANRDGASLIAMALRAHKRWDRVTGRETVMQVVRQVSVPVLAVTPELDQLPRRVLVAMDFSRSSVRATRVALRLVKAGASVVLAYVRPLADFTSEVNEGAAVIAYQGVNASFAQLLGTLEVPDGVEVRPMLLDGRPGDALLAAAMSIGADMIAVGRHRRDFLDRMTIGSVTTQLIRDARWSLLVTPPGPGMPAR